MLAIRTYPDLLLKKKAGRVERITPEILALIPRMKKAMKENQGIGLAAPQIGISMQICIVQDAKKPRAFLNPRIVKKSKKQTAHEEGCLSLPGLFVQVKRADKVELVCLTPKGEKTRILAEGLAARIFQHEIDHLQGKLIINRISPWKRWKLKEQLKGIARHDSR